MTIFLSVNAKTEAKTVVESGSYPPQYPNSLYFLRKRGIISGNRVLLLTLCMHKSNIISTQCLYEINI